MTTVIKLNILAIYVLGLFILMVSQGCATVPPPVRDEPEYLNVVHTCKVESRGAHRVLVCDDEMQFEVDDYCQIENMKLKCEADK